MTYLDGNATRDAQASERQTSPRRRDTRKIRIPGGRTLTATPVFETYWRVAHKSPEAFMRRVRGAAPPWSDDAVISTHRFTNAYRASDRVSQYLIRNVQYAGPQTVGDLFFRTMLFKLFNRVGTWEQLVTSLGDLRWKG